MTETVDLTAGAPTPPLAGVEVAPPTHAIVPAAKRLTVQRVYTTPGLHPYDAVTWERRDVVMTNWRDGSINFEQRGVEFPDSWSVNAANIVTTKYFRGAVGTPQRESSLRQLIDRVVERYVETGRECEYFGSEEDVEVFGLELTHCLLHQIFSFNSPVWFNVGTSAPQQVSACFILAVDDQMDAILDWYKEEGIIFKGGSGSGVNLSRIRSSKELLSSGGTASGPVSFMRGADASAGTIKSGGATRRAAKMVVLDVDHPDIEEFIQTKAREEDKIRVLRDAGFDMDLGGLDITSVQYQNANNSVRVSDEFMRAYENGELFGLRGRMDGSVLEQTDARQLMRTIAQAAWACADPGMQYDDTINDWHTNPETGRISASNPCSEYMSLDNSSCNLASLNLLTFLGDDGTFDAVRFAQTVEFVITAMEISISFADFPTDKIGQTTRAYRQLGIGYANLGALLMATGHAYDSDSGRAFAAAITSLMTGTAYKRSAEIAGVVGPYAGYARNASAHQRVMRKHAAANDSVRTYGGNDATVLKEAAKAWQECLRVGEKNGWRNAQASVLAPTGCLTADTLITTDRGLVRLGELGDPYGDQWQTLQATVSTDEGPRPATKFFINGEEPTRRITTEGGYRIQGTLTHRIKVVDEATGAWEWKRLADVTTGDLVPVQLGTIVGEPNRVVLPVLDDAHWTADQRLAVPETVDAELAELVGYYMGDGSMHAKGLRFCVADTDLDVVERLRILVKGSFNVDVAVTQQQGYQEVAVNSVRLARWWQAAGFSKVLPGADHTGKGWQPRVPSALLESNDREVYAAFLRGLFEADGCVLTSVPSVSTASEAFASELQTLFLSLGMATSRRITPSGWGGDVHQVRLRNLAHAVRFGEVVGFISGRKAALVARSASAPRVEEVSGYLFERIETNEDGGVQPTYDLSVPSNVTYVANGLVSHNTIGLMMDCDTTGIEPDLALVKLKKLVGGASMHIVNHTVPRALRSLGYTEETVEAIVEFVAEHGHVIDAPGLRPEHYSVFDCAMGERSIQPMGHVRMMAAVQPFISGAISKTINMPESATVEDVEQVYIEGWKLGLKALAIYRDNCKVGQPLSAKKKEVQAPEVAVVEAKPQRKRLPKKRPSQTISFSVAGAEGYLTAGSYPDDGLGEIFVKMSKQGSTLAGVMDAFSVAISIGLQYGVPLEAFVSKFTNMRFDPAGMTDDPDVRIANSVMDYLFRRLALDYLPFEQRSELGIYSAEERARAVATGSYTPTEDEIDVEGLAGGVQVETPKAAPSDAASAEVEAEIAVAQPGEQLTAQTAIDAPLCFTCGVKMRPAGSCYVCESCGSTSGCS
jgi:ribonucleoside-diphosphate reductase alpha chain